MSGRLPVRFYERGRDDGSRGWVDDDTFEFGDRILRGAGSPLVDEWPKINVSVDWLDNSDEYLRLKYQGAFSER